MIQIPQSTTRIVMLKLFLTGTTTAATSKTLAITISKNGGAFANPSAGATNATELSNGWYIVTLSTTDTNTVGDLVVRGTASLCDDSERVFGVVSAITGGLTALPSVATGGVGSVALGDASGRVLLQPTTHTSAVIPTVSVLTTLPTIPANWLTAAGIANGAITSAKYDNTTCYPLTQVLTFNVDGLPQVDTIQISGEDAEILIDLPTVIETAVGAALTTYNAAQPGDLMGLADGAITDAKITLPTEATGTPSTFLQLMMWVAGHFGWRKVVKDATTIKQFMNDGTTTKTTSTYSVVGTTETINKAS